MQVKKGGLSNVGSYYFKLLCHTSLPTFLPFIPITLVNRGTYYFVLYPISSNFLMVYIVFDIIDY